MKRSKGLIYLFLAGLVGLLAALVVDEYTAVKIRAHIKPTARVVVAASDISPGTPLNGNLVKAVNWPQDLIPPQAVMSAAELNGRVVKTEISRGEPVLLTKLAPRGTAAGLSGLVGLDKRAFTVRVDDVSGVAGFIHPGDQVDVLAELPIPHSSEHFSRTILQNIRVLTAGQVWEQKGEQKPAVVNTLTLELSPQQGELLNLASNQGKIRLVLRNQASLESPATPGVATSHLLSGAFKPATPTTAPAKAVRPRAVEVIKGLERSSAPL